MVDTVIKWTHELRSALCTVQAVTTVRFATHLMDNYDAMPCMCSEGSSNRSWCYKSWCYKSWCCKSAKLIFLQNTHFQKSIQI